jgi:hypothetical protein
MNPFLSIDGDFIMRLAKEKNVHPADLSTITDCRDLCVTLFNALKVADSYLEKAIADETMENLEDCAIPLSGKPITIIREAISQFDE